MAKKPKIFSVFPGCGKTYTYKNFKDKAIVDCDYNHFKWSEKDGKIIINPDWPHNYITHIEALSEESSIDYIFVSDHKEVRKGLDDCKLKYTVVCPAITDKDEWIVRLRKAGYSEEFLNTLDKRWDKWILDLIRNSENYYTLNSSGYLIHVLMYDKVYGD